MQTKVITNAIIYTGGQDSPIENGFIRYTNEVIEVGEMNQFQQEPNEETMDAKGKIVIPGMIDVHIHGGHGIDVMDADSEKLRFLSKQLLAEGVTSFFATTITQSNEAIENALKSDAKGYFTSDKNKIYNKASYIFYVEETKEAYLKLAGFYKNKINPYTIAVTGSSGKTTVK